MPSILIAGVSRPTRKLSTTEDAGDAEGESLYRAAPLCPPCAQWWRFFLETVRLAAFAAAPLLIAAPAAAQAYPSAQLQTGQRVFVAQCGFCHGRDAAGGETGPDLTRSALVAQDVGGDKLGPVVTAGRTDKGMPAFRMDAADLAAVVAFIHDQKTKAAAPGGRRGVDPADLETGNAA